MFAGKVYNITPYMKFHPGGKEDLMKGAGKDCTILFDEVRPSREIGCMLVMHKRFASVCACAQMSTNVDVLPSATTNFL